MALMVNGKKVLGYAIGGNEFYSLDKNADGLINIGGQNYLSTNKMNITISDDFTLYVNNDGGMLDGTLDVTSNLSDYGGDLAIIKMHSNSEYGYEAMTSRPFSIPTTTTTNSLSFYSSYWSGSLSMNTDNSLILTVSCNRPNAFYDIDGKFYIVSHDAS